MLKGCYFFFHRLWENECACKCMSWILSLKMTESSLPLVFFSFKSKRQVFLVSLYDGTRAPVQMAKFKLGNLWRNSLHLIKNKAHVIALPLAYLFNQSITFSEVPLLCKHFYVTPSLRNEPSGLSKFCTVSSTSIFCRFSKKILKKHILEHFKLNKIFLFKQSSQHRFVNGKSSETNTRECLNEWTALLDESKTIRVLCFDFVKALDRGSDLKLIYRLNDLGTLEKF